MIPACVEKVRAALAESPSAPTLEEVAEKSELSARMASRALDVLECLGEVRPDRRYSKGRRGALPQVFVLLKKAEPIAGYVPDTISP